MCISLGFGFGRSREARGPIPQQVNTHTGICTCTDGDKASAIESWVAAQTKASKYTRNISAQKRGLASTVYQHRQSQAMDCSVYGIFFSLLRAGEFSVTSIHGMTHSLLAHVVII